MAKITADEVKRLAKLAMLSLDDKEVDKLSGELQNIFGMIEEINQIDTKDVEETAQVTGLRQVSRPDEIEDYGVSQDELLKAVPKHVDGNIEVPSVQ